MKKKLITILSLIFVAISCVFVSACGSKYGKMKFNIQYAFSSDAEDWTSIDEVLDLNFRRDENTSLYFDGQTTGMIYLKVEIDNVKSKNLGTISVSANSTSGMVFDSVELKNGQVLGIRVTGTVNSQLSFVESKSGKQKTVTLNFSECVNSISVNNSTAYAFETRAGNVFDLKDLNNVLYTPSNTKQKGVEYYLDALGSFEEVGTDIVFRNGGLDANNFFRLEDSVLTYSGTPLTINKMNYCLRVKVKSKFIEDEDKTAYLYVYLVENLSEIKTTFADIKTTFTDNAELSEGGKFTLYSDANFSSTSINTNFGDLNTIYKTETQLFDSTSTFTASVLVDGKLCDFSLGDVNINGLIVSKLEGEKTAYKFSCLNLEKEENRVTIQYTWNNFRFVPSKMNGYQNPTFARTFTIKKSVLPSSISVNGVEVENGDSVSENIYYGSSSSEKSFRLRVSPVENLKDSSLVISYTGDITILDENSREITNDRNNKVANNSVIRVKFNNATSNDPAKISVKLTKSPKDFKGGDLSVELLAEIKLTNIITATDFALSNSDSEITDVGSSSNPVLIENGTNGIVYLFAKSAGGRIDNSSIRVSVNGEAVSNFVFNSANPTERTIDGTKYYVYTLTLSAGLVNRTASINVVAGDESTGVNKKFDVKTVYVASSDDFFVETDLPATRQFKITSNGTTKQAFAVAKNAGYANFALFNGEIGSSSVVNNTIYKISKLNFNEDKIRLDVFNNDKSFAVLGKNEGLTDNVQLEIEYYKRGTNGIISLAKANVSLEYYVYVPIGKIEMTSSKSAISYVEGFEEASKTTVNFRALGYNGEEVSTFVKFSNETEIKLEHSLILSTSLTIVPDELIVKYGGNTVTTQRNVEISDLSGSISVEIKSSEIKNFAIKLSAGNNVSNEYAITVKGVDLSTGINIDTSNLNRHDNSYELEISFLGKNTAEVVGEFGAEISFADINPDNIRYSRLEDNLNYAIEKYENGNWVEYSGMRVGFENGKVKVYATLNVDSGLFKLTLTTKDSKKENSINVRITDGTEDARYVVDSEEDFWNINLDLNAHYVLGANLDLKNANGNIVGLVGENVAEFSGSLSGSLATAGKNGNENIEKYSITYTIDVAKTSAIYGNLFGLFTILSGSISDLDVNVRFADISSNKADQNGTKISGLVAVNNGTLENVKLTVITSKLTATNASNSDLTFGALVGLNTTTGEIKNCTVDSSSGFDVYVCGTANIGLIAGENSGIISGTYTGNLDEIAYDVLANMNVKYTSTSTLHIGGIVGSNTNSGSVKNMILSGDLTVGADANADDNSTGYIASIAGANAGNISNVVAITLNITANAKISASGVVGEMTGGTVERAKYISAYTYKNGAYVGNGKIVATGGTVAGLVANFTAGTISLSSVENFVKTEDVAINGTNITQNYVVMTGKTVYALANIPENATASLTKCFANHLNIDVEEEGTVSYPAGTTYFYGYVRNLGNTTQTMTVYIAGEKFEDATQVTGYTDSESIFKSSESKNINKILLNGAYCYVPHFVDDNGEIIQILQPEEISSEIKLGKDENGNEYPLTTANSQYVEKVNYLTNASEIVMVNYFNKVGDSEPYNTYALSDLINTTVLPTGATAGLKYRIVEGNMFARIDANEKIVFLGVSGRTPIVVECYSSFNPNVKAYVVFFTENYFVDMGLASTTLSESEETGVDYELNIYTGTTGNLISFVADNSKGDVEFDNLLDSVSADGYLEISAKSGTTNSILNIQTTKRGIFVGIKEKDSNGNPISITTGNDKETITLTLKLKKEYFNSYFNSDSKFDGFTLANDLLVKTFTINVNMFNSATELTLSKSSDKISSDGQFELSASLSTGLVGGKDISISDPVKGLRKETIQTYAGSEDDGLKLTLAWDEETDVLLNDMRSKYNANASNKINFVFDMFDKSITNTKKSDGSGYDFKILLTLKDNFNIRNLTKNLEFTLNVSAITNESVSETVLLTIAPTEARTIRIANYSVSNITVDGTKTIIEPNTKEVNVVQPGGMGNLMIVYMEPAYSNIVSAKIESSSLFVPSLSKDVRLNFRQLVYNAGTGKYETLYTINGSTASSLNIEKITEIDKNGNSVYLGNVYIQVILEKFGGLEDSLSATLTVESGEENNSTTLTTTKILLTEYLPETKMTFEGLYFDSTNNGVTTRYNIVEEGTNDNLVNLELFGYQFNSNPVIELAWIDKSVKTPITDYVSYYIGRDYTDVQYNSAKNSYTMPIYIKVAENIPAGFTITSTLSLVLKSGEVTKSDEMTLTFSPTKYILESVSFSGLSNGRLDLPINTAKYINPVFNTKRGDLKSDELYNKLLNKYNSDILSLFTYGENSTLISETNEFFEANMATDVNGIERVSLVGLGTLLTNVKFNLAYGYELNKTTGLSEFNFGQYVDNNINIWGSEETSPEFSLNVYPFENEDNPTPIYSAEQMFDENGNCLLVQAGDYILMNDIVVEKVNPKDFVENQDGFASLDGNNRRITVKSIVVDPNATAFGLFGRLGTYLDSNGVEKQTILKNVMVDYSLTSEIAFTNNEMTSITFGGLVGVNENALIYNCDVVSSSASNNNIVLLVDNSEQVNVVAGGLVGENKSIVTNSRVGRSSYEKYTATKTSEAKLTISLQKLTLQVGKSEEDGNKFNATVGGFVGVNSKTIATSYVVNTNVINFSTSETINRNQTAGFVGSNSGLISYSYIKGADNPETSSSPYCTGTVIENKGNGAVAGFVSTNTGEINNSFANAVLKTDSSYIAGFVFDLPESGSIKQCYSATKMNGGNSSAYARQPFVGIKDDESNAKGTLENAYYYSETASGDAFAVASNAKPLDLTNFQNSDNLFNFVFVLSNSKLEREQGVWSYYTINNQKRLLPELVPTNTISTSYRFLNTVSEGKFEYRNATSLFEGGENNPRIIRSVEEFNNAFVGVSQNSSKTGYFRFINNIDFNNQNESIMTRANFTLGNDDVNNVTSVEGNGMTISGIFFDVKKSDGNTQEIGLFAKIKNAYVKNLNLNFATPGAETDYQFSTTTVQYSGGLAGVIEDSVIININLNGASTVLTGNNFVGGLAGIVKGRSLLYGITSNLSVKVSNTNSQVDSIRYYYSESDYETINPAGGINYETYLKNLSYAGGIAGVLDLKERIVGEYNISFVYVRGDQMSEVKKNSANIYADVVGGIAGHASRQSSTLKAKYYVGKTDRIRGYVAGGLYGVNMGSITASQVTSEETIQYTYDTNLGKYIIDLYSDQSKASLGSLSADSYGNTGLIESYKYGGGLVGIGADATIVASYSKASFANSVGTIGGLIGASLSGEIQYSYAVPFVNISDSTTANVGGMIGKAFVADRNLTISSFETDKDVGYFNKLLNLENKPAEIKFAFSTIIVDNSKLNSINSENVKIDYLVANSKETNVSASNTVYTGLINYVSNKITNSLSEKIRSITLKDLYIQEGTSEFENLFTQMFASWSAIQYWTLDSSKYYPLLLNEDVDNFVKIENASDFEHISSNPAGKYKIVKDIDLSGTKYENWVVPRKFTGVLIGETQSGKAPYVYGIHVDATNESGTGAGFFMQTENATISNINFVWRDITTTGGHNLDNVGLVSGQDTNSFFSSLSVYVGEITQDTDPATGLKVITGVSPKIKDENDQEITITLNLNNIARFGGIATIAENTNMLACSFNGNVNATLKSYSNNPNTYFGGLVGYATANNTDGSGLSMSVLSCDVGLSFATKFTLTNNGTQAYIGGVVGHATDSALSALNVGSENGYLTINNTNPENVNEESTIHIGGLAGMATYTGAGSISQSSVRFNPTNTGSHETTYMAGLLGELQIGSEFAIKECVVDMKDYVSETGTNALFLSNGIGWLTGGGVMTVQNCSFKANPAPDTTQNSSPYKSSTAQTVYAGGVVGLSNTTLKIDNCLTYSDLMIGSNTTTNVYAGGFVGMATAETYITNGISAGRIAPSYSGTGTNDSIYVGGFVGKAYKLAVRNLISTATILTDGISTSSLDKVYTAGGSNVNALFGNVGKPRKADVDNTIEFDNLAEIGTEAGNTSTLAYSSDVALCQDDYGVNLSIYNLTKGAVFSFETSDPSKKVVFDKSDSAIWRFVDSMVSTDADCVPKLIGLNAQLKSLGIITNTTYTSGLSLNPIIVNDANATTIKYDDSYNYYILKTDSMPAIGTLNGVLIGNDKAFESGGVIEKISRGSAVSNIHINVASVENVVSNNSFLVKENLGVIYNCSVQGNGIKLTKLAQEGKTEDITFGVIVRTNNGVVSHSYSGVEIISADLTIGGIAYQNNGLIETCYFTGYVESSKASAGIAHQFSSDSYFFNNYMAGVITTLGANSFVAKANINGSRNYIDSFANAEEIGNAPILQTVSTAELMLNKKITETGEGENKTITFGEQLLVGTWNVSATDKDSDGNLLNGVKLDTASASFGYNFGYPVLNFKKNENNYTYQSDTGNGTADNNQDISGLGLSKRQEKILDNSIVEVGDDKVNLYNSAFKIPHLGVLSAVQSLVDVSDLNYVLIYDIDGSKGMAIGQNGQKTAKEWTPIGSNTVNNGFVASNDGFRGVFVSNKYLGYTLDTANPTVNYCQVTNVKHQGLFAGVHDSYISNLFLGTFTELEDSGALGTTATGETTVRNIELKEAKISAGENGTYISALFGEVSGNLTVSNFKGGITFTGATNNAEKITTAGLIAGKQTGGTISFGGENNFNPTFIGVNYAGGLVGEMTGGTILDGTANTIVHLGSDTQTEIGDAGNLNGTMGGVVGKISNGTISNITVQFSNKTLTINTNSFGGLVGEVANDGNAEIKNCTITGDANSATELTIFGTMDSKRAIGLVAGKVDASFTATNLKFENVKNLVVADEKADLTTEFNQSTEARFGVGGFIGVMTNGTAEISVANGGQLDGFEIESNIPNLGGIVGCVLAGTGAVGLNIDKMYSLTSGDAENAKTVVLKGITNVGGAFGYYKNTSRGTPFLTDSIGETGATGKDFLNSDKLFAEIKLTNSSCKNFGGLFGVLESELSTAIANYNTITAGNIFTQYDESQSNEQPKIVVVNVGGVAGKLLANLTVSTTEINIGINNTDIMGYQNVGGIAGFAGEKIEISGGTSITQGQGTISGVLNVGGVVGYSDGAIISGFTMKGKLAGNASVGGIVGLAGKNTKIENTQVGTIVEAGATETGEVEITAKLLWYTYRDNKEKRQVMAYQPTSIGGLVGTIGSEDTVTLTKNTIANTKIISDKESSTSGVNNFDGKSASGVVSTISNGMISVGDLKESSTDLHDETRFNLNGQTIFMDEQISGFGGIAGTVLELSKLNVSGGNTLNGITIDAELGVNVGSVYGAVVSNSAIDGIALPTMSGTSKISVSGAYNIGGLFGFVKSGENVSSTLSLSDAIDGSIEVQNGSTVGMYVGGLVGKLATGQVVTMKNTEGKIKIYSNNNYYVGGLVGRYVVTMDGLTFSGDVKTSTIAQGNDDHENVGGFIGMLKATADLDTGITIKKIEGGAQPGTQPFAFTINTIENQNYFDGKSQTKAEKIDTNVYLVAQAYYINQDSFNICGSDNVPTDNPLLSGTTGWHKEYTAFRIMQRCIPKGSYGQGINAPWDSISRVYDAKNILAVITNNGKIDGTVYDNGDENLYLYAPIGVATLAKNRNGDVYQTLAAFNGDTEDANRNDRQFTIEAYSKDSKVYSIDTLTINGITDATSLLTRNGVLLTSLRELKSKGTATFKYVGDPEIQLTTYKEINCYEISQNYENAKGCYKFEVIYSNPSQSGSIFEVGGLRNPIILGEGEGYTFLQKLSMGFGVGLLFAIGLASGGLGFAILFTIGSVIVGAGMENALINSVLRNSRILQTSETLMAKTFINGESQSIGYLSNYHTTKISYKDGEMVGELGNAFEVNNCVYYFCSMTRPKDYYENYQFYFENDEKIYCKYGESAGENAYKTYEYIDGAYYYNSLSADVLTLPTNELNDLQYNDEYPEYYTMRNGIYYVAGVYDGGKYNIISANTELSQINGEDDKRVDFRNNRVECTIVNGAKTYKLNGKTLKEDMATTIRKLYFEKFDGTLVEEGSKQYCLGYGKMQNAYYTYDGDQSLGLTKYATYQYQNDGYVPFNIDNKYSYLQYEKTEILSDDDYQSLETGKEYYTMIKDGEITKWSAIKYYLFAITGEEASATHEVPFNANAPKTNITMAVYPKTFTNPYASNTSVQDGETYVYSASKTTGLYQEVTYFYYDSGYYCENNKVYVPLYATKDWDEIKDNTVGIFNAKGEKTTIKYSELFTNGTAVSSAYASMYITKIKDENDNTLKNAPDYLVGNAFKYHDGIMYIYNSEYSISADGYLNRVITSKKDNSDYVNNKFLANKEWKVYTMFKYVDDQGKSLDFNKAFAGSNYYLIPQNVADKMAYEGSPNGRETILCESVKVTLGGEMWLENTGIIKNGQYEKVKSGSFTIS